MAGGGLAASGISRWFDCLAATAVAAGGRIATTRIVDLVEEPDGTWLVRSRNTRASAVGSHAGDRVSIVDGKLTGTAAVSIAAKLANSRVDVLMLPDRFVFRPLELPARASEFLDGIVRAQIDRLTPWSAADAAFGWGAPRPIANDRIIVTVAATARAAVTPLVAALAAAGARTITIYTAVSARESGASDPALPAPRLEVFQASPHGSRHATRARLALVALLATVGSAAALASLAAWLVGADLEARQTEVSRRIAEVRLAIAQGRGSGHSAALTVLQGRKYASAPNVVVLEALAQVLPDHTYVTELRITADKLQVIGMTRDAPSLIRLFEQSPRFTQATFFAPTTRSTAAQGENFNIEARIEPLKTAR